MSRRRRSLGRTSASGFVDAWTPAHAAAGALVGFTSVPWWGALLLSAGWEAAEHPLKDAFPRAFPTGQESVAGSVGDVVSFMAGYGAARLLRRWWG